jgi:hypothetical protein
LWWTRSDGKRVRDAGVRYRYGTLVPYHWQVRGNHSHYCQDKTKTYRHRHPTFPRVLLFTVIMGSVRTPNLCDRYGNIDRYLPAYIPPSDLSEISIPTP